MRRPLSGCGFTLIVAAVAALMVVEGPAQAPSAGRAQEPAAGNAQGAAQTPSPNPPAKVLVPVAFSTISSNPKKYYGELVSLTATVAHSFSPLAFSIDQDRTKRTGREVLVLARRMSDPIALNTYVTVVGEFVEFDPVATPAKAKDFTFDLPSDIAAAWIGRPTVLATAVVNDKSVDLARFIPPPKTPEETAYNKLMWGVSSANGELRKGIAASNVDLVKKNAAGLTRAFTDAETFWQTRGRADAVKWLSDARTIVESIEKALEGPDWAAAKSSSDALAKICTTCHNAYRERLEDGSFRVKPGGW